MFVQRLGSTAFHLHCTCKSHCDVQLPLAPCSYNSRSGPQTLGLSTTPRQAESWCKPTHLSEAARSRPTQIASRLARPTTSRVPRSRCGGSSNATPPTPHKRRRSRTFKRTSQSSTLSSRQQRWPRSTTSLCRKKICNGKCSQRDSSNLARSKKKHAVWENPEDHLRLLPKTLKNSTDLLRPGEIVDKRKTRTSKSVKRNLSPSPISSPTP